MLLCVLVTIVIREKMAEPIEMTRLDPKNHVLDVGVYGRHLAAAEYGLNNGLVSVRLSACMSVCPTLAVQILKLTR